MREGLQRDNIDDEERTLLANEETCLAQLRADHRDVTKKTALPFEGADETMARDVEARGTTRQAYLQLRGRKRAEAKRKAGLADRQAERMDLERRWHDKHDIKLEENAFVPQDPFQGSIEEEVVEKTHTFDVVDNVKQRRLDADRGSLVTARSAVRLATTAVRPVNGFFFRN